MSVSREFERASCVAGTLTREVSPSGHGFRLFSRGGFPASVDAPDRFCWISAVAGAAMPKPVKIYGLATCDTTRAARKWLDGKKIAYAFHDVREDGLTKPLVAGWVKQLGWEKVLNKA